MLLAARRGSGMRPLPTLAGALCYACYAAAQRATYLVAAHLQGVDLLIGQLLRLAAAGDLAVRIVLAVPAWVAAGNRC